MDARVLCTASTVPEGIFENQKGDPQNLPRPATQCDHKGYASIHVEDDAPINCYAIQKIISLEIDGDLDVLFSWWNNLILLLTLQRGQLLHRAINDL